MRHARTQLVPLLELVGQGETVVIARAGRPVAELAPVRPKRSFPFGIARAKPLVAPGDDWWQPMSNAEASPPPLVKNVRLTKNPALLHLRFKSA